MLLTTEEYHPDTEPVPSPPPPPPMSVHSIPTSGEPKTRVLGTSTTFEIVPVAICLSMPFCLSMPLLGRDWHLSPKNATLNGWDDFFI